MPKLLKFSCQNCGSKLAVPVSMAGMTDHCPKCNSFVTAPTVKPKAPPEVMTKAAPVQPPVATTADKKPEGWSADELKDAFDPASSPLAKALARKSAEVEEQPQQQPVKKPEATSPPAQVQHESLLELPFQDKHVTASSGVPDQVAAASNQNPALNADQDTPTSGNQDKQPIHSEALQERNSNSVLSTTTEQSKIDAAASALDRERESAFNDERYTKETETENQPPQSILSSMLKASLAKPRKGSGSVQMSPGTGIDFSESKSVPSRLPDLHEPVGGAATASHEEAEDKNLDADDTEPEQPMPGMGEVLAAVTSAGTNREGQPWLTAPFLTVTESSKQEKRQKKRRYLWMGLMAFVAIDLALLALVFKKPLVEWWHGGRNLDADAVELPSAVFTHQPNGNSTATESNTTSPTVPAETKTEPEQKDSVPAAIPIPENPQAESTPISPAPEAMPATDGKQSLEANVAQPSATPATDEITLQSPEEAERMKELAALPVDNVSEQMPVPVPAGGDIVPLPGAAVDPSAMPAEVSLGKLEPATSVAPVQRTVGRTPAEAKAALDALLKFLDAKDWKERAKFSQNAKTLQPAMEKHAREYGDGPIRVSSVDFVDRHTPAGSPPYCMFELNGGDLEHRVLALIEQPKSGNALVDWDGFMEFRHDYLLRFLETNTLPPQKFRVMLRRKHYFDKDVPDLTQKDTFQINQPNAVYEGHVFVPKSTALSRQLANQLGWDKDMPVIVELAWRTNGNKRWVEIQSIPKYGWRG